MFQHILFPVDFSERCKQAVPFVKAFAERYQAAVTLMHVVQIPAAWYGGFDAACPVLFDLEEMEKVASQGLAEFYAPAAGAKPDHSFTIEVTQGDPGIEIVAYAAQANVDLIMLPTHGYGKFRRWLLGSVTAQVLHDSHCPVWTATHVEQTNLAHPIECRQMLCAVDRSANSLPVIKHAVELAGECKATLCLVHAVPDPVTANGSLLVESQRIFLHSIDAARKQIDDLQHLAGTGLKVCVMGGSVSEVVREAAVQHAADLVVIGRGRIPERFGGLRSNAYAIIRDSPCPVLSV
jgi:nucleotide-binding universal stress UspA family protein